MMIMRRLVLIRFPMTYKGCSHQPAQRFRVACAQELRGIFNILSVYFYTPNIMESLMARELFMDIGREIMSMEDCIKCYDNGDNTQQSAPGPGVNIQVWHGSSGSQYCWIAAYCPVIAFPRVGGVRGCVIMLEPSMHSLGREPRSGPTWSHRKEWPNN